MEIPFGSINRDGKTIYFLMEGEAPAMQRKTIPFLESQGVDTLKSVWISHGDADHIGGLLDGMQRFCPEQIVTSSGDFKITIFQGNR